MDYNIGIIYLGVICIILIICKVFIKPIKVLIKILAKSIIGGIFLYIVNHIGIMQIGINLFTILSIGILGIPGLVMLVATRICLNYAKMI